jgi:hypothetical protein
MPLSSANCRAIEATAQAASATKATGVLGI